MIHQKAKKTNCLSDFDSDFRSVDCFFSPNIRRYDDWFAPDLEGREKTWVSQGIPGEMVHYKSVRYYYPDPNDHSIDFEMQDDESPPVFSYAENGHWSSVSGSDNFLGQPEPRKNCHDDYVC